MSDKVDIKEIKEVLVAVHVLAVGAAKIKHDKVSFSTVPQVVDILKHYQEVIDAVKDVNLVIPELKDLDSAEAAELLPMVIKLVSDVKKALEGEDVVL